MPGKTGGDADALLQLIFNNYSTRGGKKNNREEIVKHAK